MDIVFVHKGSLDVDSGIRRVRFAVSPEQVTDEDIVYAVWGDEALDSFLNAKHNLYIPYRMFKPEYARSNQLYVYLDLANYSFFKRVAEEIKSQPKGVLRVRRQSNQEQNPSIMAEDLFVLAAVCGEPEHIKVLQSKPKMRPAHVILTVHFQKGAMAHLEYTFTDDERIEFEWSGIQTVLEFDSEAMNPFQPNHYSRLPLVTTADSIIEHAHKPDSDFISDMERFHVLVKGGTIV